MRCRTLPVTYMLLLGSYYQIESHIFSLHRWKLNNKKVIFLNLLKYSHNYSEDRRIHILHAYICNCQERKPLVRHCDNKKQHDYGKYYVNLWLHTRTQSKIHLGKYIHIQIFFLRLSTGPISGHLIWDWVPSNFGNSNFPLLKVCVRIVCLTKTLQKTAM